MTYTDRELLELAAKAAGIELPNPTLRVTHMRGVAPKVWNPLTDDGDALRLASHLLIDLQFFENDGGFVNAWCQPLSDWLCENVSGDPLAATRRAIVRAAAEIGKTNSPTAACIAQGLRRVRKIGGSFQHIGTVVAEFKTTAGEPRIVLEFDAPVAGMLHVYRPDQVEDITGSSYGNL